MTSALDSRLTVMQASPRPCDECPPLACKLSVSRVTFYLHVWRQARLYGEAFEDVLAHHTRDSRHIDPGISSRAVGFGKRSDDRALGWTLDQLARTYGVRFLHPMNALAVAAKLCPERFNETD